MNWFDITVSVASNLAIACIVAASYHLSYEYAKKHYGWPGYKMLFWVVGVTSAVFLFTEYQQMGPLNSGLSSRQKEFVLKAILTIVIPVFVGILTANRTKKNFYREIKERQIELYQHYVDRILSVVDIQNNTNWAQGKTYDKERLGKDDAIMEDIAVNQAGSKGLKPIYLQIMANQYFFADPWERERDKERWVSRVLRRRETDYFPDPWVLYKILNGMR